MTGFGERLKLVRAGLPQKEFAEKLGFHFNTIGRWERGEKFPTQPDICKILSHYPEINPTWLLIGDGSRFKDEEIQLRKQTLMGKFGQEPSDCHSEERLERRRLLLARKPGVNFDAEDFELLEHIFGKIADFKETHPGVLKEEDLVEVGMIGYSFCQKENHISGALICTIVQEWLDKLIKRAEY